MLSQLKRMLAQQKLPSVREKEVPLSFQHKDINKYLVTDRLIG